MFDAIQLLAFCLVHKVRKYLFFCFVEAKEFSLLKELHSLGVSPKQSLFVGLECLECVSVVDGKMRFLRYHSPGTKNYERGNSVIERLQRNILSLAAPASVLEPMTS